MTHYTIPEEALTAWNPWPDYVRVYRQFGPWLVHLSLRDIKRGRRWVVTYAPVGRRLPAVFTQGRAVKIARALWRRGLDPLDDADRAVIVRMMLLRKLRGVAR